MSDNGALRWGVKASLREYLRECGGEVRAGEGAHIEGEEVVFPQIPGDPGAFSGSVHLTAHGGMLDWMIASPRLNLVNGYLEVTDRSGDRVDIAVVQGAETVLLQSGTGVFDGMYPAGSAMDPVRVI